MGLWTYTEGKNLVVIPENRQGTATRLRDFARVGQALAVQRMVSYSAAILLAGYYYDHRIAIFFYIAILVFEVYDGMVLRFIMRIDPDDTASAQKALNHIFIVTFFSAATISLFCVSISIQQGAGGNYFLPIFILISASIFAAMNNNQFLPVLSLRLVIYMLAILYIPIRDVLSGRHPITSEIWLNFFTVLFVLGFIFELARNYLSRYSASLKSRQALEVRQKQALVAIEAKTRFLATVSHELRTPLTSIKGALDILNSGSAGEAPEKLGRLLDMAGRNSNRLNDLVSDLLFIQLTDAGKLSMDFSKVDLGKLVMGTIDKFRAYADDLDVAFKCDVQPDLFFVQGDPKRLDQVVANLLSNAAKFSHQGGLITVALDRDGFDILLTVADTGIGIPESKETEIFEDFGQVDSSDERKFQGSGLGLSISQRIVAAHGGQIDYDSKLGEGTTFKVRLTADDPKNHAALPEDAAADTEAVL